MCSCLLLFLYFRLCVSHVLFSCVLLYVGVVLLEVMLLVLFMFILRLWFISSLFNAIGGVVAVVLFCVARVFSSVRRKRQTRQRTCKQAPSQEIRHANVFPRSALPRAKPYRYISE